MINKQSDEISVKKNSNKITKTYAPGNEYLSKILKTNRT